MRCALTTDAGERGGAFQRQARKRIGLATRRQSGRSFLAVSAHSEAMSASQAPLTFHQNPVSGISWTPIKPGDFLDARNSVDERIQGLKRLVMIAVDSSFDV